MSTELTMLKERIEKYGTATLLPEEILSLLSGADLAIIRQYVETYGIIDMVKYIDTYKLSALQKQKILLVYELLRSINIAAHMPKTHLANSDVAGDYCKALFQNKGNESFYMLCISSTNHLIQTTLIQEGIVTEVQIHPRVIVENAIKYKASSVIVTHNHPGGSLKPSNSDLAVNNVLKNALEPIRIKLMDHIIVGGDQHYSMAEHGQI